MIVINTKNYKFGKELLDLSKDVQKYLGKVVIAVPSTDIREISEKTKLIVYSQHVVPVEDERHTGFVISEAVKSAGAKGTLVNHSEHKVSEHYIKETLRVCEKKNFGVIVCVSSLNEAKKILKLRPRPLAIALEDKWLIGTGKSITKYKSGDIAEFVKLLKGSRVLALCGAGISDARDVFEAYRLGCEGVLIASAIAKNKNYVDLLKEIKELKGLTERDKEK